MNRKNSAGFTLIELIVVAAIISIIAAIVVSGFFAYEQITDLDDNVQGFVNALKLAQNKTLSSDGYSQYGVYINTQVSPNQYVLFKGISYASREVAADSVNYLQDTAEFFDISLGGGNEIVFDRLTGASEESGNVSIRIKADTGKNRTVYIANSGVVGFSVPVPPSDTNRIKDSRHIQFAYSRVIDTVNENVVLTLDNSVTRTIKISTYLVGGEFQWQDTVSVGGSNQIIEINTHRLNNPDTLFSIRRDKRYNDKILNVTISGDSSGYLAQYSADGVTTNYSSIYVSGFAWQ